MSSTTPSRAHTTDTSPEGFSAYFNSIYPDRKVQIDLDDPKSLRSIFFNPDLETSARVLQALLNPQNSLATIAYEHATTIEAVSAWMAKPDIAQRIFHLKRGAAVQHSLAATFQLKHAVNALTIILQEYTDSACHEAGIQAGRGASPSEHIRRDRETALRACLLLARLANFDQTIRPPRNPREHITTPHSIPTVLPTSNGSTAKGFATIESDFMQSPRGHAGAHGDSPQRDLIDHDDLMAQIRDVLGAVGASMSRQQQAAPTNSPDLASEISNFKLEIPPSAPAPVPPVAGSEPEPNSVPIAQHNPPTPDTTRAQRPVPENQASPIARSSSHSLRPSARETGDRRLPDAPASGTDPSRCSSPMKWASEPPESAASAPTTFARNSHNPAASRDSPDR